MKVAIIGGGNMGLTYARSFLHYKLVDSENLLIVEKNIDRAHSLQYNDKYVTATELNEELSLCDVVIIAVKPQDFIALSAQLKSYLKPNQLVISIMAGISLKKLDELLSHNSIIRAMPNTPAQIGMGVTVFTASEKADLNLIKKADKLLSTTGTAIFIEEEKLMDAVTAVSGSGPAYFYFFVKHMIEAGMKLGMDESMAHLLVKQTMLGAYHLMNTSEKSLDELIASVKSKGGTTEAALNVFSNKEMGETVQTAIFAAENRAKELSNG